MVYVFLSVSSESDTLLGACDLLNGSLCFEHRWKGQGNVFATLLLASCGNVDARRADLESEGL
jgi:hypothetical protein